MINIAEVYIAVSGKTVEIVKTEYDKLFGTTAQAHTGQTPSVIYPPTTKTPSEQLSAAYVEKSLHILSEDAKTNHEQWLQVYNKLNDLTKQQNAFIKSQTNINADVKTHLEHQAQITDTLATEVYKLADAAKAKAAPAHAKMLDHWDMSVDGIGNTTVTELPYRQDYLVRYMKNGVNHHQESVTLTNNPDITFTNENGKLAYKENVAGLGMIEIWSPLPKPTQP